MINLIRKINYSNQLYKKFSDTPTKGIIAKKIYRSLKSSELLEMMPVPKRYTKNSWHSFGSISNYIKATSLEELEQFKNLSKKRTRDLFLRSWDIFMTN